MRHHLAPTLAVASALLLGACTGQDDRVGDPTPVSTPAATALPTEGTAPTAGGTATSTPDGSATTSDTDLAATTGEVDQVEGGAEGQAAADRAKAFLLALVTADPQACEMLLSFSDPELPMTSIRSDLELCRTQLPATMEATVEAQGLGEEGVAILEAMQIRGADVEGERAVVDRDNYSDLFADAMGESTITLRKVGQEWYVDLDAYLETP